MNIDTPALPAHQQHGSSTHDAPTLCSLIADLQRSLTSVLEPARAAPSTTLNELAGPTSALSTSHNNSSAKKRKYDAALLHPLAVSGEALSEITTATTATAGRSSSNSRSVKETCEQLSRTLGSFEAGILNSPGAAAPAAGGKGSPLQQQQGGASLTNNEKIRLFALLKERAVLLYQKNIIQDSIFTSSQLVQSRLKKRNRYPFHGGGKSDTVQTILERLARECGLEIFAGIGGEEEEEGQGAPVEQQQHEDTSMMDIDGSAGAAARAGGTQSGNAGKREKTRKTTVTMAGKGLVLDMDIELPVPSLTAAADHVSNIDDDRGTVLAVRFSHGMEGATDPGIDRLLTRQAQSGAWDTLRTSLFVLSSLDALVVTSGSESQPSSDAVHQQAVDPFGAMKTLSNRLESVFEAELEVASSPRAIFSAAGGHGLPLLNRESPYASVVYHLPAESFFCEAWERLVESGFRQSSSSEDDKGSILSSSGPGIEGIRSITFRLERDDYDGEKYVPPAEPPRRQEKYHLIQQNQELVKSLDESLGEGLNIVAVLDSEVILSQAAGREMNAILRGSTTATSAIEPAVIIAAMHPFNQARSADPYETLEQALLPTITAGQSYSSAADDTGGERPSEQQQQHHQQIQLSLTATASSFSPSSSPNRAFRIREFSFKNTAQLLGCIQILRTQCLLQEFLRNSFQGVMQRDSTFGNYGADEASIKLDDLFSDEPSQDIAVSLSLDVQAWPPVLVCTMAVPHLPGWLPLTLQLRLAIGGRGGADSGLSLTSWKVQGGEGAGAEGDSSSASAALQERIEDILFWRDDGKNRLETVLETSRDIKDAVRWIGMRMAKYPDAWRGLVDKPRF